MSAYACPFCDYTAPLPNSVKGHITASADDDHQGESGPEFSDDELLDGDEHPDYGGDPADSADESAESDEQASEQPAPEQDSAEPPEPEQPTETAVGPPDTDASTDGGTGIVPEQDSVSTVSHASDDSAEPECPGCGNTDTVQSAEAYANAAAEQLDQDHIETLESSDYVCGECGGVWDE